MAKKGDNGGRHGSRWRIAMWSGAGLLLLLPLVAMRFTNEVNWDAADFIVMGVMLAAACGTCDLALRMTGNGAYRAGVGLAVAAAFLLIWVNLAVGILGGEGNPANLMFGGVIAVALLGAIVARFRAEGMAQAMAAAATAQALVCAVALAGGLGSDGFSGLYEAVLGTTLFGGLWLLSAWQFRRAATEGLVTPTRR